MKAGWQTKAIGKVFKVVNGGTPKTGVAAYWDGPHAWITPAEMGNLQTPCISESRRTLSDEGLRKGAELIPAGSVILSSRAPIGHLVINEIPMAFNQGCKGLIPPPDIDTKFAYYFLMESLPLLESLGTGATFKELSGGKLKEVPFHFPELTEQHRIVTLLDEAFADIATAKANAEKNLQSARDLFSSHLQSIFTTRGEGWEEKPLGDIGKVSMCKRIFKEQTTPTGDIPFYKIGTFGKQADAFIPAEIYREFRQKYSFPNKGDVLVSAAGTVGRRVVYDGEDAYFQDSNIVWIANDQTKVLNHFLYHFYGACDWNASQGATISRLYNDNLRQIVIAFPQSLDEQNRIARQLDVMSEETNRLTEIYRQKLTALDELKKSLLHQAFSGAL